MCKKNMRLLLIFVSNDDLIHFKMQNFGKLFVIATLLLSILDLHAEYKLVWNEEFGALDANVWNHDIGWGSYGWGNNEQEYYTSNAENIFVKDSKLNIVALRSDAYKSVSDRILYTSAKIHTQRNVSIKYGKVEARIHLPERGDGVWPAFWMLGENQEKGWPYCGEIDICEWRGSRPQETVSTMHWNGTNAEYVHCDYGNTLTYKRGLDEDFFVYGLEWTPEKAEFYIVDEKDNSRHRVNIMDLTTATVENGLACFHQAQYIILNLAMGGQFGGDVTGDFKSRTMQVDWIRVYQDNDAYPESRFYNNSKSETFAYNSDCNMLMDKSTEIGGYYAPNWNEMTLSASGDAKKFEISLPSPTFERWQAQYSLTFHDVEIKKGVKYDMSFTIESDAALNRFLLKVYDGEDDNAFMPTADLQNYNVEAGKKKDIVLPGMTAPCDMSQVKVLFDFGANPAATVTVSDMVLRESDCNPTSVADKGNEAFNVYADNGRVVVDATDGGVVEIYTVDGRCVMKKRLSEGMNHIDVPSGIYVVKTGNITTWFISR